MIAKAAFRIACLCFAAFPVCAAPDVWTYWVQPCSSAIASETGCHPGDPQLAEWALQSWRRAAGPTLSLNPASAEKTARMRIYWVSGRSQLYGEARPFPFEGVRGAEVFVLPSIAQTSEDALLRETIVYLTCVHESGHGLGLEHTADFNDIMYSFQFGGDIAEYFGRFRRGLASRDDIAKRSAISPADRAALLKRYRK